MSARRQKSEGEKLATPLTEHLESIPPAMNAIYRLVDWMTDTVFQEGSEFCEDGGPTQRRRTAMAAVSQMLRVMVARSQEEYMAEMEAEIRKHLQGEA